MPNKIGPYPMSDSLNIQQLSWIGRSWNMSPPTRRLIPPNALEDPKISYSLLLMKINKFTPTIDTPLIIRSFSLANLHLRVLRVLWSRWRYFDNDWLAGRAKKECKVYPLTPNAAFVVGVPTTTLISSGFRHSLYHSICAMLDTNTSTSDSCQLQLPRSKNMEWFWTCLCYIKDMVADRQLFVIQVLD